MKKGNHASIDVLYYKSMRYFADLFTNLHARQIIVLLIFALFLLSPILFAQDNESEPISTESLESTGGRSRKPTSSSDKTVPEPIGESVDEQNTGTPGEIYETDEQQETGQQKKGSQDLDIDALSAVQLRAMFLPDYLKDFADTNAPLPIAPRTSVPSAECVNNCFEALQLENNAQVYIIGYSTGFLAAFFAQQGMNVTVSEQNEDLLSGYRNIWQQLELAEINQLSFSEIKDSLGSRNFDAIIIHAAVQQIPSSLLSMLAAEGTLLAPLTDVDDTQIMIRMQRSGATWSVSTMQEQFFPGNTIEILTE